MVSPSRINPLTHEELVRILHYNAETGILTWIAKANKYSKIKVGDDAGCLDSNGYLVLKINYLIYYAHRLAWFYMHGVWPIDLLDHINQIRADNRLINLRESSHALNAINGKHRMSQRGLPPGAHLHGGSGKYRSRYNFLGKRIDLGVFEAADEANIAYETAVKERNRLAFGAGKNG